MENFSEDLKKVYNVEFLRRASRVRKELDNLFLRGRSGSLIPALFSLYSYLWTGRNMFHKNVAAKLYD